VVLSLGVPSQAHQYEKYTGPHHGGDYCACWMQTRPDNDECLEKGQQKSLTRREQWKAHNQKNNKKIIFIAKKLIDKLFAKETLVAVDSTFEKVNL
jgi:hypothetical protein